MEEWYTLDSIEITETDETLYCISVDNKDKQFLIGNIHVPTHNSEEEKEEAAIKGRCRMAIGSIARLGRAAGVHLVVGMQRPDAKMLSGETRSNFAARVACGKLESTTSSMTLESSIGTKIRSKPKGGMYVAAHGKGNMGQGFFAPNDWLEKYYKAKGMPIGEDYYFADNNEEMGAINDVATNTNKEINITDWSQDMEDIHNAAKEM